MAEAAAPERQMKRTLDAFDLTAIGIGAIIGTGIFALIGTAIAGQTFPSRLETPVSILFRRGCQGRSVIFGRAGAGPAMADFIFCSRVACGFAALCYAELASMIPVSGSAYTYSYATLGEIVAWIIGWDLILEYAVGNMAVAVGWSGYFVQLCDSLFGLKFPIWSVNDHRTAAEFDRQRWRHPERLFFNHACPPSPVIDRPEPSGATHCRRSHGAFGLRNSRERKNEHNDRHYQSRGRCLLHLVRRFHGASDELASICAEWFCRGYERCSDHLLRLHRFRRHVDDG